MAGKQKEFDPQIIATTIMGCVQNTCETMCKMAFSKDPEFNELNIIEYDSRMRTFGLEKFNEPCYASFINFYISIELLTKNNPIFD